MISLAKLCDMVSYSLRNYITKDWFRDIAFHQEPSPLAKRIAEVLGVSDGGNEGKGAEK